LRIGAALADARWQAHLTVDEVSHRTRIREAIIWGIEKDDFSACGGDAYARGHIRAIAQAVGTDPDPLIAQYDETYRTNEDIDDVVTLKPPPPPRPGRPAKPHRRRILAGSAGLGVVVLAVVAWAVYHVASGVGHPKHSQALAASGHSSSSSTASGAAANGQGSPQPTPTTPSAVPTTPSPSPTPTHSAPPAPTSLALSIAGATAFGPGGEGTGDTPQNADLAIDSLYSTGWRSDWYTTSALGNLKPGTGLLLDMGRRVTINDAQLDLGGFSGADLQLKAGNSTSPGALHEVASANGASGRITVNLKTPARAKYLLIWFTQLPSDGAGTYRAAIYHVIIRGHS
jgi:cytoskeleton protein RodZ